MATQSQPASLALHEILLGIADSLNQAQQSLRNMPPYDQFGRPNTVYQLPYLDFELKVTSDFEVTSNISSLNSNTGGVWTGAPGSVVSIGSVAENRVTNSMLKFRPSNPAPSSSNQNNTQIESTISGRFVAVMPNDGLPQVFLQCTHTAPAIIPVNGVNYHEFMITATLTNSNREHLANARIEFNFDSAESYKFNNGIQIPTAPIFSINEGQTDENGELSATVKILSTDFLSGLCYIFVVNYGPITNNIFISN